MEEQLTQLAELVKVAEGSKTKVGTYLIAVFGGFVGLPRAPQDVVWRMQRLTEIGVQDWILADSGGYASPVQMREMVQFAAQYVPLERLRVQVHDSRGMGLANIAALAELGVTQIDTALAGSGAHPASPAAQVGGVCTEDVAQLLSRMGIETGLDLNALIDTANWFSTLLDGPQPGFTRKVGRVPENMGDVQAQLAALKAFGWRK